MKKISLFLMMMTMVFGFSQELVSNGAFNSGATGWSGNAVNVVNPSGSNPFNEANVITPANPWDANLSYVLPLTPNAVYVLSFDAWTGASTPNRTIVAGIGLNHGPWDNATQTVTLSTTQTNYSYTFTAPANSDADCRVIFDMGASAGYVGIDNVSLMVYVPNVLTDATLSDLKVDGTTVTGFSPTTYTYTVSKPNGTVTVPQITAATTTQASPATAAITQASAIPGSATVLVTAQDGTTTKTYTVNYTLSGPAVAAPTPPARLAADVISVFSNAYANIPVSEWSTSWDDSNITDIQVAGNDTKKIDFTNFLGVQLTNYTNATDMTHFHMDYYIDAGTDLVGKVINPKWSNHATQSGETSSFLLNHLPSTTGSWVSIDVPVSDFTIPGGQVRNSLYQFIISSNIGTLYVDNIYFHKNTVLGTNESQVKSGVRMYPNPAKAGEMVTLDADAQSISIYSIDGKLVNSASGKTFSTEGLQSGIYMINSVNKNGSKSSSKLIVK